VAIRFSPYEFTFSNHRVARILLIFVPDFFGLGVGRRREEYNQPFNYIDGRVGSAAPCSPVLEPHHLYRPGNHATFAEQVQHLHDYSVILPGNSGGTS
jgi:hypothetical protein